MRSKRAFIITRSLVLLNSRRQRKIARWFEETCFRSTNCLSVYRNTEWFAQKVNIEPLGDYGTP